MQINKRAGDVVLPGRGWHWILAVPTTFIALIILGVMLYEPIDTRSLKEMSPEEIDQAKTALKQRTAATPPKPVEVAPTNKQQEGVRAMADFMVKDENIIGLRMWARSLGVSSPEFSSAATLREEIRRASNDFAIYRASKELTRLIETLRNN